MNNLSIVCINAPESGARRLKIVSEFVQEFSIAEVGLKPMDYSISDFEIPCNEFLQEFRTFNLTGFPVSLPEFEVFARRRYSRLGVSSAITLQHTTKVDGVRDGVGLRLLDHLMLIRLKCRRWITSLFHRRSSQIGSSDPDSNRRTNYSIPLKDTKVMQFGRQILSCQPKPNVLIVWNPTDAVLTAICDVLTYTPQLWGIDLYLVANSGADFVPEIRLECWRSALRPFANVSVIKAFPISKNGD